MKKIITSTELYNDAIVFNVICSLVELQLKGSLVEKQPTVAVNSLYREGSGNLPMMTGFCTGTVSGTLFERPTFGISFTWDGYFYYIQTDAKRRIGITKIQLVNSSFTGTYSPVWLDIKLRNLGECPAHEEYQLRAARILEIAGSIECSARLPETTYTVPVHHPYNGKTEEMTLTIGNEGHHVFASFARKEAQA